MEKNVWGADLFFYQVRDFKNIYREEITEMAM